MLLLATAGGLWIVIARTVGPKQSHESKERLLRFARNDIEENCKTM